MRRGPETRTARGRRPRATRVADQRRRRRSGHPEVVALGVRRLSARRVHDAARDARSPPGDLADGDVALSRRRMSTSGPPGAPCAATLLEAFAEHDSLSVQHTLYAMGQAVLDTSTRSTAITLVMPNKHHLPVDLSRFGLENRNEIFVADRGAVRVDRSDARVSADRRRSAVHPMRDDLVLRPQRTRVLPDGVRPATIQRRATDGSSPIGEHGDRPAGVPRDRRRRARRPARAWSTRTCTSTTRAAPTGRASSTRRARRRPAASRRSSTCRSTAFRRRRRVAGLEAKRARGARPLSRRRRLLGRRRARQCAPTSRRWRDAGVLGFKCFLSPSGVDEFGHVSESDLREALPVLAALGLPLLAHAELAGAAAESDGVDARRRSATLRDVARQPAGRQRAGRDRAAGAARGRVRRPRPHRPPRVGRRAAGHRAPPGRRGVALTVETCPHYLTFAAEEIADGATAFKCAPPIRDATQSRAAVGGARCRRHRPRRDRSLAGAAGAQAPRRRRLRARVGRHRLAAAWTVGRVDRRRRARSPDRAARGVAGRGAARRWPASPAKGAIAVGRDADLVVWDPDAEWTVDAATLYHRHPVTPYDGRRCAAGC